MIRFAPALGLLLASPVVVEALLGRRTVDDALLALLVGVVAAGVGLSLLGVATRRAPEPPARTDDEP
ncbi:MAG: hypothetical protein ACFCVF_01555 [Kineosporiaceae bacterium]